jgi:hypothetical protein
MTGQYRKKPIDQQTMNRASSPANRHTVSDDLLSHAFVEGPARGKGYRVVTAMMRMKNYFNTLTRTAM